MFNLFRPRPAPPAFGQGKVVPEGEASLFSKLVFLWLGPFLAVGFSRPLEKEDLWELPDSLLTSALSTQLEENFYSRCPPENRPACRRSESSPSTSLKKEEPAAESPPSVEDNERQQNKKTSNTKQWFGFQMKPKNFKSDSDGNKRYDSSLLKALHRIFFIRWWTGGILVLIADTLQTTTPLVNKVILTWLADSFIYHHLTDEQKAASGVPQPRGIGYGIGLAFALFAMQEISSLLMNHYMMTTMVTGVSVRTAVALFALSVDQLDALNLHVSQLVGAIFRKSLRLSGRARLDHNVGQITTMISTDATRLDLSAAFAHSLWVAPIQIIIGVGLLLGNLGYSALVGLGVIVIGFPLQFVLMKILFAQHMKGVKITDQRARITTEILQGIRLIKFYAWESFYAQRIGELRARELQAIKKMAIARSALIALVTFIPALATILSFITYALSGHELNVAIIFSSLQYFNIIRTPLIMFPLVLANISDAAVALSRISKFLTAEELAEPYTIDYDRSIAVDVDGDFTWETAGKPVDNRQNSLKCDGGTDDREATPRENAEAEAEKGGMFRGRDGKKEPMLPFSGKSHDASEKEEERKADEKPFELKNLRLKVPKGSFVAIVGRVGSGKSSILQALIGEMRRTNGHVVLGGSVAYVPQTAWIRNATLRENVIFGREDDDKKFWDVIRACSLEHDLDILPNGENTAIGEKGINLSGGQKARVSLARAAYSSSEVVLLDDSLSAVDAYVGKAILENCLLNGPLADRTRILATHSLHVLDKTDYIYIMEDGTITEAGTYVELMQHSVIFSRLMEEYGHLEPEKPTEGLRKSNRDDAQDPRKLNNQNGGVDLMQVEERNIGAVPWKIYSKYLRFAGGLAWGPVILLLLTLLQLSEVGNNLFLGFWTASSFPGFHQGDYIAVYTALALASAIFSFLLSLAFALASLVASLNLFKAALLGVLRSPVSFFDTTPMGRILSRLSKDQDTLDNELSLTLYQFLSISSSIIGTVALVFYTFPYLGIIFAPLSVFYGVGAMYYRRTSVETKRLDSIMRSALYGSYSETLTGLPTVRAYRDQDRSINDADVGLDWQNRAYYMTVAIQRWLGVRLDFFGNTLILGIALFAAAFRNTVNPSKIGVVLSYALGITQTFAMIVQLFAQNEQNMNAVERVLCYSELCAEGDTQTPNDPPASWPEKGMVKFINCKLAYREDLPLVLNGISFEVTAGEKLGIVGRTGAGKSSLMQALFRIVEPQSGEIEIDGVNIRNIGLDVLRARLALVPQDSTLFLGTLRDNLDPHGTRTDTELISILQRAWLLPKDGPPDPIVEAKFSLDSVVGDEGSNFSAGEKQLLALCRALVKNSRIIVLDEATSSVDVETDSKLQKTIQTEFATSTLLCIAHRLNTIAYYDRVLVMDGGKIAEFDTVLNLFDKEDSIFRSLCNQAGLSRQNILRIRQESQGDVEVVAGPSC